MKPLLLPLLLLLATSFNNTERFHKTVSENDRGMKKDTIHYPEETHFRNFRQLTFGGDNAEAYWSYDSRMIVFQRTSVKDGIPCDQIFVGAVPEKGQPFKYKMVSTGKGRTTCAFFTSDNKHIVYASTHKSGNAC